MCEEHSNSGSGARIRTVNLAAKQPYRPRPHWSPSVPPAPLSDTNRPPVVPDCPRTSLPVPRNPLAIDPSTRGESYSTAISSPLELGQSEVQIPRPPLRLFGRRGYILAPCDTRAQYVGVLVRLGETGRYLNRRATSETSVLSSSATTPRPVTFSSSCLSAEWRRGLGWVYEWSSRVPPAGCPESDGRADTPPLQSHHP